MDEILGGNQFSLLGFCRHEWRSLKVDDAVGGEIH